VNYTPKNTDEEYLSHNWFDGDESDVKLQRTKMVKVRKSHRCALSPLIHDDSREHQIQPGERAWVESGVIDGDWQRNYACCECMDAEIQAEKDEYEEG
jgi:hypothetical protein